MEFNPIVGTKMSLTIIQIQIKMGKIQPLILKSEILKYTKADEKAASQIDKTIGECSRLSNIDRCEQANHLRTCLSMSVIGRGLN